MSVEKDNETEREKQVTGIWSDACENVFLCTEDQITLETATFEM